MSEMVILYSSYPLSGKEFNMALEAVGEGYIEGEGTQFTGAIWDGERAIFLYGDWVAPDPEQFWEKELRRKNNCQRLKPNWEGGQPQALVWKSAKSMEAVYWQSSLLINVRYVGRALSRPIHGTPLKEITSVQFIPGKIWSICGKKEEHSPRLYLSCSMTRKREICEMHLP